MIPDLGEGSRPMEVVTYQNAECCNTAGGPVLSAKFCFTALTALHEHRSITDPLNDLRIVYINVRFLVHCESYPLVFCLFS